MEKEFSELINANQGIIHKFCYIYCDNQADYDDLFQEVLLNAWKSFKNFEKRSKFSTWLYRVAFNTALNWLRTQKKQKQQISLENNHTGNIHQEEKSTQEDIELLYKAIQQLNEIDRSLALLYLDELSYKEIAQILGISENNVAVKMNRIRQKLKDILKPEFYGT